MCRVLLVLFLFNNCVVSIDSAKILGVFPFPSYSHQVVFRPITQELAKRGHDVTVITPNPAFPKGKSPRNLREIDIHDACYGELYKITNTSSFGTEDSHKKIIFRMMNLIGDISENVFKHEEVEELIESGKANKYDFILIEAIVRPMFVLSHIFDAPIVLVSSFGGLKEHFHFFGAPTHFFIYPTPIQQKTKNLNIFDKLKTLLLFTAFQAVNTYYTAKENRMLKRVLGEDTPNLQDIKSNIKLILLNVHQMWDSNRPVPPGIVYMGGIHQKPKKELPQELKSCLDNSQHGVIYLSFGTNVHANHIEPETLRVFVNVLSKLPYNVLWKWDTDNLPGRTENIKLSRWFPQSDILHHPKVLLFITQAGLQSTDEAITAGVPLLGLPIFGDQWYNADKYEEFKIGVRMDIHTINEDEFSGAIEKLINDNSYRRNTIKLRSQMNDQLNSPLDRAVFWIEHILRHGSDHIKSPAADMSIIEYIDVPLLLTLMAIALGSFTLACVAVKLVMRRVFGRRKIKNE